MQVCEALYCLCEALYCLCEVFVSFLVMQVTNTMPAIATKIEINCEVDKVPTLPRSKSPRKNSMKKRPFSRTLLICYAFIDL